MHSIRRKQVNGRRYYEVKENETGKIIGLFPSITTVLGETSDKSGLDEWRKRVGEEEANRISSLSLGRGNILHRLLELYKPLEGEPEERLELLKALMHKDKEIKKHIDYVQDGWDFFMKFWHNHSRYFDRVKRVIEAETFLWSAKGGGYAGTTDNVSEMIDGKILIIDYKNSRKPKRDEWIQDYFMQAAAYWVAYWERSGVKPDGAEIWIANEIDNMPQTFTLTNEDIKYYFTLFTERLKAYKETANI